MKSTIISIIIVLCSYSSNLSAANLADVQTYNQKYSVASRALVSKNYDKAFKNFLIASKLGHKSAQYSLALLYMEGLGTKQDYAQAYLWLNLAAESDIKKWVRMKDKIHNSLSVEQRASLRPHVDLYIEKYGSVTQEISCSKTTSINSHKKHIQCVKKLDDGLVLLDQRIKNHWKLQ
jgi:hypothetical protein